MSRSDIIFNFLKYHFSKASDRDLKLLTEKLQSAEPISRPAVVVGQSPGSPAACYKFRDTLE